jgi:hypothetical protein
MVNFTLHPTSSRIRRNVDTDSVGGSGSVKAVVKEMKRNIFQFSVE